MKHYIWEVMGFGLYRGCSWLVSQRLDKRPSLRPDEGIVIVMYVLQGYYDPCRDFYLWLCPYLSDTNVATYTIRWPVSGLMLAHRQRICSNISPVSVQLLVFAVIMGLYIIYEKESGFNWKETANHVSKFHSNKRTVKKKNSYVTLCQKAINPLTA